MAVCCTENIAESNVHWCFKGNFIYVCVMSANACTCMCLCSTHMHVRDAGRVKTIDPLPSWAEQLVEAVELTDKTFT